MKVIEGIRTLKIFDVSDINRYKVTNQISMGSSYDIFQVVEKETKQKYVFKILKPSKENNYSDEEDYSYEEEDSISDSNHKEIKRFVSSADIMSTLNSPFILKIIGLCVNFVYRKITTAAMFLEYCQNGSMDEFLLKEKNNDFSPQWNDTKKFICIYAIAVAMSYMHSQKILHLDLNPKNILLDENLHPKICDFWASKKMRKSDTSSQEDDCSKVDGDIPYMAPELLCEKDYSTPADVYSFGVTVHEILTGERPIEGGLQGIQKIMRAGGKIKLSEKIPKSYQELILKCLSFDPHKRPTFSEIVSILRNDKSFITDNSVNEDEFLKFCKYADLGHPKPKPEEKRLEIKIKPIKMSLFKRGELIGKGEFSNVYRIVENRTQNSYAAKINMLEIEVESALHLHNITREINILSKLNSNSILRFVGYSENDFDQKLRPTIVTELARKGSLDQMIKLESKGSADPKWNDTKKLISIYGIAYGMSYLHSLGILHRDLKPENIFLDDSLFPKIGGFRSSKEIVSNDECELVGTPSYWSPEFFKKGVYQKPCDVYSFALIVYQILTLEEPFKGFDFYDLLINVTDGYRPEIDSSVPDCYCDLIEQCWSQDPSERPTFDEIVDDLKTNPDFITSSVDQDEFIRYTNYLLQPASNKIKKEHDNAPQGNESPPQNKINVLQNKASSPQNDGNASQYKENVPQNRETSPQNRAINPQAKVNDPQNRANMPQAKVNDPQNNANLPQAKIAPTDKESIPQQKANVIQNKGNAPPQSNENVRQIKAASPQTNENSTQGKATSPQAKAEAPQTKGNVLQNSVNSPQTNENVPQNRVSFLQNKSNVPQNKVAAPQSNENVCQTKVNVLQNKNNVPQTQVNAPQNKVNVLQNRANVPQTQVNMYQNKSNAPQSKVAAPQSNENVRQTKVNVLQNKNNVPQTQVNAPQSKVNVLQNKANVPQTQVNMYQNKSNVPQTKVAAPLYSENKKEQTTDKHEEEFEEEEETISMEYSEQADESESTNTFESDRMDCIETANKFAIEPKKSILVQQNPRRKKFEALKKIMTYSEAASMNTDYSDDTGKMTKMVQKGDNVQLVIESAFDDDDDDYVPVKRAKKRRRNKISGKAKKVDKKPKPSPEPKEPVEEEDGCILQLYVQSDSPPRVVKVDNSDGNKKFTKSQRPRRLRKRSPQTNNQVIRILVQSDESDPPERETKYQPPTKVSKYQPISQKDSKIQTSTQKVQPSIQKFQSGAQKVQPSIQKLQSGAQKVQFSLQKDKDQKVQTAAPKEKEKKYVAFSSSKGNYNFLSKREIEITKASMAAGAKDKQAQVHSPLKPYSSRYDPDVFISPLLSPTRPVKPVYGMTPDPIKLTVTLKDIGLEGLDSPVPNKASDNRKQIVEDNKKKQESQTNPLVPLRKSQNDAKMFSPRSNTKPVSLLSSAKYVQKPHTIIPKASPRASPRGIRFGSPNKAIKAND
ncbi:hypothetical protein M9Y10_006822 [Tritrichomonas musculus]|uniref:Protein kinase domain-containing protein n=1 Tax=Tritrichomonas musculus TaxID=1915356 RepID=A0ABR2JF76_9EUKA